MRRGHWRKGKEIHPNTQRSALMSANRPTTPVQVPLDTPKKDMKEGRKKTDAATVKLETRCTTEEKDRRYVFTSFGLFFAVATPVKPKTKKKQGYQSTSFLQIISTKNWKKKKKELRLQNNATIALI